MNKTIILDFDGVFTTENIFPSVAPPTANLKESLDELKEMGFTLKLHSCRTSGELVNDKESQRQLEVMEEFVRENDLPIDEIITDMHKPVALYYIDDRAIEFKGKWEEVVERIRERENDEY